MYKNLVKNIQQNIKYGFSQNVVTYIKYSYFKTKSEARSNFCPEIISHVSTSIS